MAGSLHLPFRMPARRAAPRSRVFTWLRRAAIILPLALLAAQAWYHWHITVTDAHDSAGRAGDRLAEQLARVLAAARVAIAQIDDATHDLSPEDLTTSPVLADLLRQVQTTSMDLMTVGIVTPNRKFIDARAPSGDLADVADRDFAVSMLGSVDKPFIGGLNISRRGGGSEYFSVSAPMSGSRLRGGRIVAMIGTQPVRARFEQTLDDVNDAVMLKRGTGETLMALPPGFEAEGEATRSGWQRLLHRTHDWPALGLTPDGRERFVLTRQIADWPAFIVYASDEGAIEAAWLRAMVPNLLSALAMMTILVLLIRHSDGLERRERRNLLRMSRWRADRAAARERALVGNIVTHSSVAILSVSRDEYIRSWNPAAERMLGYTAAEAIGRPLRFLLPPGLADEQRSCVEAALSGTTVRCETTRLHRNGCLVRVAMHCAPLVDASGEVTGLTCTFEDISRIKDAEKEIADGQMRIRLLMDANVFGVGVVDCGRLVDANIALADILGTPPGPPPLDETGRLDILWRNEAALAQIATDGASRPLEAEIRRFDGKDVPVVLVGVRMSAMPLRWLAVVLDITERRTREATLRNTMQELNHRSKNLLTMVQVMARQIGKTSHDPATFVGRLTDRLLGLAAAQDVLVNQHLSGAGLRDLLQSQIVHVDGDRGGRIRLVGPDVTLDIRAAHSIGMAIHELATNAAKYGALSGETGHVTLEWGLTNNPPASFRITWQEIGGPPVSEPKSRGFGTVVLKVMTANAVTGTVDYRFPPTGVHWQLCMPDTFVAVKPKPQLRIVS